ncbi:LysM peptidoglycan-binding domain-containing protein [Saccharopolyspora phatthalungensis]|uniref:Nucleoid-associated protein YgaU n=1 Tax=Saccharopolyspora phatthalungensis TaxID=664693 RepID=A0A840Q953_9PSEU|nr:Gmad2 immunoglobulin-like domain-containing protein [Saccharopolyspora phatthalungensis]MBB5159072.1 nucleoid-associated protein YgaU [Saccharopolyspora phatthalungensis]
MTIDVQQPRTYDLVGNTIQAAGVAGGAFEANFKYRVHEGHDEATGNFMAGDGAGGHSQFQITVDVAGASFVLDRLFLEVFHVSPRDGAELDKVVVPIILGPKIVPGYQTYLEHVVASGETLWGIATKYYGSGNLYYRLVAANPGTITNPNLIQPGDVIRVPQGT